MRRPALTLALASLCSLAVASVVSQNVSGVSAPAALTNAAPASGIDQDRIGIDRKVATAVADAVERQFAGSDVRVELEDVALQPASIRDRSVGGYGRVRLGGTGSWIPFRFEALYDTETARVSAPRLALGEQNQRRESVAGDDLSAALAGRVEQELRDEFSQQPFDLLIDRVITQGAGDGIVHVRGLGTVDFGDEGSTQTRIDALYDSANDRWLRVSYELGGDDDWSEAEPRAIAAAY